MTNCRPAVGRARSINSRGQWKLLSIIQQQQISPAITHNHGNPNTSYNVYCCKWAYAVESLVYADTPQMLDHLEDDIRRVIADIRPQMLEKAIENWTSRLDYNQASLGSHMPEIIFKM
ncbi:hypothetical protein TNCV_4977561 [Trichonephila clavipes]|nr:hypothetical protein TNCV_4977561 [Trichonephila clavipes]